MADATTLVVRPSHAFGRDHESTEMCLQALAAFAPPAPFRMLDVGSGTGVLSIAAARLGGEAVGIDIDEAANVEAEANARLNDVADRVSFGTTWPEPSKRATGASFDVVIANILCEVLLTLAPDVIAHTRGLLVLSGLVSTDVPAILAAYVPKLGGRRPEIFERGRWRALVWRLPTETASPAAR